MTFDNIRSIDGLDDTDLRTSLQTARWNKHMPAIKDEFGNVIVGHRRLKIAAEEGIEPVIEVVTFGTGPEADAARLQLAVVSNVGPAPLTKEDRTVLEARLYDEGRGLTMEQIAKIVGVTKMTVSNDLRLIVNDFTIKPAKTVTNPKGAGRKKKVRAKKSDGKEAAILARKDESSNVVAADLGVPPRDVRRVREREEVIEQAKAEPNIDPDTLKLSDKKKFDLAIKQYQKKLAIQFEALVRDAVTKRIDEMVLPYWKKQIEEAKELYTRRRALMSKKQFDSIRRCLHTDRLNKDGEDMITPERLNVAFNTFMALEKYLINEKDSPTKFDYPDGSGLPDSLAEWDKMRAKASASRAKRPSGGGNVVRAR